MRVVMARIMNPNRCFYFQLESRTYRLQPKHMSDTVVRSQQIPTVDDFEFVV